jgi:hypothetical protein
MVMVHWWVPKGNEGSRILKENVFAHFLNYLLVKGVCHGWKVKFSIDFMNGVKDNNVLTFHHVDSKLKVL